MSGLSIVTILIIVANVLVSLKGFNDQAFFEKYKFSVGRIRYNKEYYRLLTSGFLHVDYIHLFFNMFTLYVFSQIVIAFFGSPLIVLGDYSMVDLTKGSVFYLVLYLLSVVCGNLLAYSYHKDEPYYSAVGASGGVSGILFSSILVYPTMTLGIFFVIPMPAWIFAFIYLGYSVYGMRKGLGNIGHAAHLGGAVIGLLATLIYFPDLFTIHRFYVLIITMPIVGLFVLMLINKKK